MAAAVIAIGLVIPGDIEILAGIYAFGATLSIAIAHAAVLRMRGDTPASTCGRSGSRATCASAAWPCRCRRWSDSC